MPSHSAGFRITSPPDRAALVRGYGLARGPE